MSGGGPIPVSLVEDAGWERLRPLTWLRPSCDLLVGALTIRERWHRAGARSVVSWCRPHVGGLAVGATSRPPDGPGPRLWARDRFVPEEAWAREAVDGLAPAVWVHGRRVVAARVETPPPAGPGPVTEAFWEGLAGAIPGGAREARGEAVAELSDLVRLSAELLERDLEATIATAPRPDRFGDGHAYAPERIRLGESCRIDHGAVLDARAGPVVLGARTIVQPSAWIEGPFGCREDCHLLGGRIGAGSYLGPGCRVRGELESTTVLGWTNKAHDGFVGHSYVGEWVNLGALTTTSDLKNNYGPVRLEIDGRRVETGQRKLGSVIGDHAKTRIGAMLNTGSVIGLAANLFGEASMFPKWVPDFTWGAGDAAAEYALDRCLEAVAAVMARRARDCTPQTREAIGVAFRDSRDARRRFLEAGQHERENRDA